MKDEYLKLQSLVLKDCPVPTHFFTQAKAEERTCFYFFSRANCRFIFVDSTYESFTGYPLEEHKKGGLGFWFSKVHYEDRQMLGDRITEALKTVYDPGFERDQPTPHILNYRFHKGNGEWIWMQETVYIVSLDETGAVDKILIKMRLLDTLTVLPGQYETLRVELAKPAQADGISELTKRERQVLRLIAEGLSSKMIAHELNISINTVETHRRHLLEKLNVKNSMELIRKAFRLFWT